MCPCRAMPPLPKACSIAMRRVDCRAVAKVESVAGRSARDETGIGHVAICTLADGTAARASCWAGRAIRLRRNGAAARSPASSRRARAWSPIRRSPGLQANARPDPRTAQQPFVLCGAMVPVRGRGTGDLCAGGRKRLNQRTAPVRASEVEHRAMCSLHRIGSAPQPPHGLYLDTRQRSGARFCRSDARRPRQRRRALSAARMAALFARRDRRDGRAALCRAGGADHAALRRRQPDARAPAAN